MTDIHRIEDLLRELESRLELPVGFIEGLSEESDWSFVIKSHALLEAVLTDTLAAVCDPRLAPLFGHLQLGGGKTGKVAFLDALELLGEDTAQFLKRLSALRNTLVHHAKNLGFSFVAHVESLSPPERHNLLRDFAAPFPEYASILAADDHSLFKAHARLLAEQSVLAVVVDAYFRAHPSHGNPVAHRAVLDAALGVTLTMLVTAAEMAP